jgi:hypothetical protein
MRSGWLAWTAFDFWSQFSAAISQLVLRKAPRSLPEERLVQVLQVKDGFQAAP